MDSKNNKADSAKKFADQIKEALIGNSDDNELESDTAIKIFDELSKSEDFEKEIELILACLYDQTLDLTKLQSKMILLIKKCLGKIANKEQYLKIDEKILNKSITEVSQYLMIQRSKAVKEAGSDLGKSKDKLQSIGKESRDNLKRLVKGFAVYQVYMFMNPKRIAGETKQENFAHNMIKGGMELAKQYEGGSEHEIKSYSKSFVKKLEKAHQAFKSGGRTIY